MKKLISFVLVATLAVGSIQAQSQKKGDKTTAKEPAKAAFVPKVQGPGIEFQKTEANPDPTVHDYGQITQGASGDCEFVFQNVGSEPLILANVQSSCGCTVPSWPREPIAPGATASIKVTYDTKRLGNINKSITVTTNGDPERIVLRITGSISAAN